AFAILLCSLLFIAFWKDRAEQREFDRVSAVTSAIIGQYSATYPSANLAPESDIARFIKGEAQRYNVRVLAVGGKGEVLVDSSGDSQSAGLQGKEVLPAKVALGPLQQPSGFISWRPDPGAPGNGLVWLTQPLPKSL